jgi:creatinine amidohydrolase
MTEPAPETGPRAHVLYEANYRQLLDRRPNLAILPWGATEAHNYHLPHGTDVIEAAAFAERAAGIAAERGARPIVLPTIPFGNNAQQQDQAATIHCSTATAAAILHDVARSLTAQGIDRLLVLNGHGGNDFKPIIRDASRDHGMLICLANFFQMCMDAHDRIFEKPGDHAHEMETSLLLHLHPEWVQLDQAGPGERKPFAIEGLKQEGVWAPRPWSAVHPDTGCGDPSAATAEKGREYLETVSAALAEALVDLSKAEKGDVPYL